MQESDGLEYQNKNLRTEIVKLEQEKKRLMEVLAMHEPSCVKRFLNSPGDGSEGNSQSKDEEFRVPQAPAATANRPPSPPTLSAVQSQYQQQQQQQQQPTPYDQHQDASNEIKDVSGGGGGGNDLRNSCSFENVQPGNFLAKRPFSATYLDMDSRCIAL